MREIKNFEYENGATYNGECIGNVRDGKGVYSQNGVSIYGVWKDNHLNGVGKMTCPAFTYDGEFLNTLRHGKGKEVHSDGTVYDGEFQFGHKHGKMLILLTNGATVDCTFFKGKGVGDGIMTMTDGEKVPVYFKDGALYFKK